MGARHKSNHQVILFPAVMLSLSTELGSFVDLSPGLWHYTRYFQQTGHGDSQQSKHGTVNKNTPAHTQD